MTLEKLIEKNEVFSSLNRSEIRMLVDNAKSKPLTKNEWLVYAGDIWSYIFLVGRGRIVALKESREGRVLNVMTLEAGEIFWGFSFFKDGAPMPVSLRAVENCLVYLWHRDDILPLIRRNGMFSWNLSRLMVERMQVASDLVEGLAFRHVTGRLAKMLLDRYKGNREETIARNFTLDDVAAQIGSTREMVCRVLYKFADTGAIQINRTELKIKNLSLLESEAGFIDDESKKIE